MLTPSEFRQYCRRLNLSNLAISYIERVRTSGPSRKVRCGRDNVTARYPSRKMASVVAVESHTVELAFAYLSEHDPDVLEYWPQPPPIKLCYWSAQGHKLGVTHTPDFFLALTGGAGWIECKPEERLLELAVTQPNRYKRGEQCHWDCPPGREAAAQWGLFYRVWSPSEVHLNVIRNLRFLEDYLFQDYPEPPATSRQAILGAVRAEPGILLSSLVGKGSGIQFEDVYALIGKQALYIDLQAAPLAQPHLVKVYVDRVDALKCITGSLPADGGAQPQSTRGAASSSIELVDGGATIESPTAEGEAILRGATERELSEANLRYLILSGRASITEMKGSWITHYRWRRAYHEAEKRYGCGLIGLLTRYRFSGRTPGYPKEVVAIADQAITDHYFSPKAKTLIATYGVMALACERQGLAAPSRDWLRRRIAARLARHEKTMRQQAAQPLISEERLLQQGNMAQGERPWDNAHVDHHLCDIELVCSETGLPLGRPWLSLMLDGFSRRVLAFVLSFDKPSYRALVLLMRECGRVHHRLPDSITVDGGPEFIHKSFDVLCARYNVIVKRRPATRKECGAIIDRLFGTLGTQFFQNLAGCTRPFRDGAVPSIQAAARKNAVWTLEEIYELLNDYLLQFHDNRLHPALSDTPRHAFEQGLERAGLRQTRQIVYDDNFILMTLPTTTSGVAQVKRGVGVRINYIDYWCDEMRCENLVRVKVPVRYDPWNIAVAWVYLAGAWRKCVSRYAESFQGRTQKELMLASTIIVKKKAKVARDPLVTAKRLAEFFETPEAHEKLKHQQLKDRARNRSMKRAEREGNALCYEI